jgi:hypothetical protein
VYELEGCGRVEMCPELGCVWITMLCVKVKEVHFTGIEFVLSVEQVGWFEAC